MNDSIKIYCPYLRCDVELTMEREKHILENHPDLLPEHREFIIRTIADPDMVRRSNRMANARIFSRWFSELKGGKHLVTVMISDPDGRSWVVTSYIARKLAPGDVEWTRN